MPPDRFSLSEGDYFAQIVICALHSQPSNQTAHVQDRGFALVTAHRAIALFSTLPNNLLGDIVRPVELGILVATPRQIQRQAFDVLTPPQRQQAHPIPHTGAMVLGRGWRHLIACGERVELGLPIVRQALDNEFQVLEVFERLLSRQFGDFAGDAGGMLQRFGSQLCHQAMDIAVHMGATNLMLAAQRLHYMIGGICIVRDHNLRADFVRQLANPAFNPYAAFGVDKIEGQRLSRLHGGRHRHNGIASADGEVGKVQAEDFELSLLLGKQLLA